MNFTRLITSATLLAAILVPPSTVSGQLVRSTLRDYVTQPCRSYSPQDPCTRSKWYRLQTGHSGFAYNCDGEECKRNSPYLYWTAPTNHPLPPLHHWIREARCDLHEALGRIADGSCVDCPHNGSPCGRADCAVCQQGGSPVEQARNDQPGVRVAEEPAPATEPLSLADRFARATTIAPRPRVTDSASPMAGQSATGDSSSRRWNDHLGAGHATLPSIDLSQFSTRPRSVRLEATGDRDAGNNQAPVNPIAPSRQRLFR